MNQLTFFSGTEQVGMRRQSLLQVTELTGMILAGLWQLMGTEPLLVLQGMMTRDLIVDLRILFT